MKSISLSLSVYIFLFAIISLTISICLFLEWYPRMKIPSAIDILLKITNVFGI